MFAFCIIKYLVANGTLFGYLFLNSCIVRFYTQHFAWGLLVVCRLGGLLAWMHWSCIDEFVIVFKSVEELYPSPLGVDSADTSQLHRKKNLLGQF
jgi:hypothetical protein